MKVEVEVGEVALEHERVPRQGVGQLRAARSSRPSGVAVGIEEGDPVTVTLSLVGSG